METLGQLVSSCHQTARDKGWHDPGHERSFGDICALLHSEVSEAFEEHRAGRAPTEVYFNGAKPEGVPIELADILIRVFDYCGKEQIDIERAVHQKMEYNKTRPHRHGGKVV